MYAVMLYSSGFFLNLPEQSKVHATLSSPLFLSLFRYPKKLIQTYSVFPNLVRIFVPAYSSLDSCCANLLYIVHVLIVHTCTCTACTCTLIIYRYNFNEQITICCSL